MHSQWYTKCTRPSYWSYCQGICNELSATLVICKENQYYAASTYAYNINFPVSCFTYFWAGTHTHTRIHRVVTAAASTLTAFCTWIAIIKRQHELCNGTPAYISAAIKGLHRSKFFGSWVYLLVRKSFFVHCLAAVNVCPGNDDRTLDCLWLQKWASDLYIIMFTTIGWNKCV